MGVSLSNDVPFIFQMLFFLYQVLHIHYIQSTIILLPYKFYFLSRLGDVLSSLTSKKEIVPYENSRMTQILADSLGK